MAEKVSFNLINITSGELFSGEFLIMSMSKNVKLFGLFDETNQSHDGILAKTLISPADDKQYLISMVDKSSDFDKVEKKTDDIVDLFSLEIKR